MAETHSIGAAENGSAGCTVEFTSGCLYGAHVVRHPGRRHECTIVEGVLFLFVPVSV